MRTKMKMDITGQDIAIGISLQAGGFIFAGNKLVHSFYYLWGPVRQYMLLVLRCPQTILYRGLLRFTRNAPMPRPVAGRARRLVRRSPWQSQRLASFLLL